jgi:hypothetical protein
MKRIVTRNRTIPTTVDQTMIRNALALPKMDPTNQPVETDSERILITILM